MRHFSQPQRNRTLMRPIHGLAVLALLAVSSVGQAQSEARQWTVSPRAGYVSYQREASLENTGFIGADLSYNFSRMFALGTNLSVARPQTNGEDFLTSLTFGIETDGDTTYYFAVSQPVTILDFGLSATARFPMARISPYVTGGVGSYSMFLNPQVNRQSRRISGMSGSIGGGVNFQVGRNAGIRLDVRDQILTNYKRDRLNPSESRFSETRFTEEFAVPPAAKETLHNLQFSIGFSFTPRMSGEGAGEENQ